MGGVQDNRLESVTKWLTLQAWHDWVTRYGNSAANRTTRYCYTGCEMT